MPLQNGAWSHWAVHRRASSATFDGVPRLSGMDSTASLDPIALGLLLLAYVAVGVIWLTVALRTNRQE